MNMEVTQNILALLILGYLRKHAVGRAAARTQDKIAGDLRGLGLEVTTRDVRDAAAALALAGWPVGTAAGAPAGCFLCETRADFLAARHNLVCRLNVQAQRVRRFDATARAVLSGQKTFCFGEADEQYAEIERAPLAVGVTR